MAGQHPGKKRDISIKSVQPSGRDLDDLPLVSGESLASQRDLRTRRPSHSTVSYTTQRGTQFSTSSSAMKPGPAVHSTTSGSSNLLWITTDRPADFKDEKIQRLISRHVMHDYQGKESGRAKDRKKSLPPPRNYAETGLKTSTTEFSSIPNVERSGKSVSSTAVHNSPSNARFDKTSVLLQEMYYPLSVDLNSVEFQARLGQLIYRHLSVWYQEQASRLCGGCNHEAWEQWMPSILENETLLYAQAFVAVNHINFLNPTAYKAECYALKGHALKKINEMLSDTDAAVCDDTIGAVLCMASAAHLENPGADDHTKHMLGLQKLIAMRGGLQALRSNWLLYQTLGICDILGTIIFRTQLALLSNKDLQERANFQSQASPIGNVLDSPLQRYNGYPSQSSHPFLSSETVQILDDMNELTRIFEDAGPMVSLKTSTKATRCELICRRLDLVPTEGSVLSQDHIYRASRLAGQIYFRAVYHNIPFASPANARLVRDLRVSLESSIFHFWDSVAGVLVWALLVGAACERTNTEDVFLAGHLSTTCLSLVALGYDATKTLIKFLWLERAVEDKAARFSEAA